MRKSERSAQARRELDKRFRTESLTQLASAPRAGWIRSIRVALGMSQTDLARRLNVSGPAINQLEGAELRGGITINKLAEVANALECTLIYALVPKTTLENTVRDQSRAAAARLVNYATRTMTLENQGVSGESREESIDAHARELVERGTLWRLDGARIPPS